MALGKTDQNIIEHHLIEDDVRPRPYFLGAAFVLASVGLSLHFIYGAKAVVVLIVVTILLVLRYAKRSSTNLLAIDWTYLLYFTFAVLSTTWSISPSATIEQALPIIIPWLATLLLCDLRVEWLCRFIVLTAMAVALLSIVMIVVSGRLAYQPVSSSGAPELRGIFAHQLWLGAFLVITLGLIAIAFSNGELDTIFRGRWIVATFGVLLLTVVLYLSRTRLYIGAGMLSLAFTWLLGRAGSRKWIAANLVAISAICITLASGRIIAYLEENDFDITLTGRTDIWEKTLSATEGGTDVWGFGLGTFELPTFDYLFGHFRPTHAHNSFIQAYFEIGGVGLAILLLLVTTQLIAAWKYSIDFNKHSYSLFLVLFCIFGSLTGAAIYAGFLTTPLCLMMLFLSVEARRDRSRRDAAKSTARGTAENGPGPSNG